MRGDAGRQRASNAPLDAEFLNRTGGTIRVVATEYAKVSVTLPSPLLERIRSRVGSGGVSGYVARALEAEERREALRAWLSAEDAEHGPIPTEVMDQVRREWLDARNAES